MEPTARPPQGHDAPVVNPIAEKVLSTAAKASASAEAYKPTEAVLKLSQHLFCDGAPTAIALAQQAGISRAQLYRIAEDPDASAWLVRNGAQVAGTLLGAVHARLTELALSGKNVQAIELYLRRFDPEFARGAKASSGEFNLNAEIANVLAMSPDELTKFVALTRTKQGLK